MHGSCWLRPWQLWARPPLTSVISWFLGMMLTATIFQGIPTGCIKTRCNFPQNFLITTEKMCSIVCSTQQRQWRETRTRYFQIHHAISTERHLVESLVLNISCLVTTWESWPTFWWSTAFSLSLELSALHVPPIVSIPQVSVATKQTWSSASTYCSPKEPLQQIRVLPLRTAHWRRRFQCCSPDIFLVSSLRTKICLIPDFQIRQLRRQNICLRSLREVGGGLKGGLSWRKAQSNFRRNSTSVWFFSSGPYIK